MEILLNINLMIYYIMDISELINKCNFFNDPEMSFLDKHIVYKDKWATFSNFVMVWDFDNKKLGQYLPFINEIEDDELDLMKNSRAEYNSEQDLFELKLTSLSQQLEKHSKYMLGIIALLVFVAFIK